MGDHATSTAPDDRQIRAFTQRILTDLHALESIIDNNLIEHGQRRVGAEQEMFLVDEQCRPLPVGYQLHETLDPGLFTTELARFNFEANLPPWQLDARFLSRLENDLRETIATVDERTPAQVDRGVASRVSFGDAWLQSSVLELFRDNTARFHVIMTRDSGSNPLLALEQGRAPELSALGLHNGTVWRWNRPCYGVSDGVAHLRIENRVLPAGPTILDEVANAALYYGLMLGLEDLSEEIPQRLPFSAAKSNFRMAAQHGLKADLLWLDGRHRTADRMLLDELIPTADAGLARAGVSSGERNHYLGIIAARVENGRTGSRWLLESLCQTENEHQSAACIDGVTQQMLKYQKDGRPVHEWRSARAVTPMIEQPAELLTVGDIMTREVFTVLPRDLLDLATNVMTWRHFRHVPVEDESGALVGVLTARHLLKAHGKRTLGAAKEPVSVASVMETELVRVEPGMRLAEAVELLLDAKPGCLMVVTKDRLIGIVTERDLLRATRGKLGAGETEHSSPASRSGSETRGNAP